MKEETKPSATTKQAPPQQIRPGVSVSIPKTQIFTELTKGKPYVVRSYGCLIFLISTYQLMVCVCVVC
jgi:hypothetical protein